VPCALYSRRVVLCRPFIATDLGHIFCAVPKMFRDALEAEGWSMGRSTIHHSTISSDGTVKILLRLVDSRLVETVGIPVKEKSGGSRLTACVSSQVGCPLGCTFCATGKGRFARNLKPHEIIEQVLAIEELFKQRVTNVVFMGMGEPLLNIASVLAAHHVLNKEMLIGQRMMTISTVGVPNTINHLATHKLQSTLAIRCHSSQCTC
jgi:23S rRNA (adenine2503-C2)-methyltransferase